MSAITVFFKKNELTWFYTINRRIQSNILTGFMKIITEFGSTSFVIFAIIFCFVYYNSFFKLLAINILVSQAIIHIIKRVINRPRPYRTYPWVIPIKAPKCKYSLPSGHSGAALTIALVNSNAFPHLTGVFLTLAFLVGFSRIYLGCHYPTDVLAGYGISLKVYIALLTINAFWIPFLNM